MGDMFDISEARTALQAKRQELLAECDANAKLQRRFDQINSQIRGGAGSSSQVRWSISYSFFIQLLFLYPLFPPSPQFFFLFIVSAHVLYVAFFIFNYFVLPHSVTCIFICPFISPISPIIPTSHYSHYHYYTPIIMYHSLHLFSHHFLSIVRWLLSLL